MFKRLARLIGELPWWLLLLGGPALITAAAIYTARTGTPSLVENASTPEMKAAISHEIKRAEGQAALDIGRQAILKIQSVTSDAETRAELEDALREIERAKAELNQQKEEVKAARRGVSASVREAAKEVGAAEAKANAAVKKGEAQVAKRNKELEAAVAATKIPSAGESAEVATAKVAEAASDLGEAQRDLAQARRDAEDARREAEASAQEAVAEQNAAQRDAETALRRSEQNLARAKRDLEQKLQLAQPSGLEKNESASADAATATAQPPPGNGKAPGSTAGKAAHHITIQLDAGNPADLPSLAPGAVLPPLPPELKALIGSQVHSDIRRVILGSSTILILVLLYISFIIAKSVISVNRALKARATRSEQEAQQASLSRQLMEAKLAAMQAQIEPHFLFNTLASVDHLIETDPSAASRMQKNLIAYLRAAIPQMRESSTTLGREAELCRAYLNILQVRMESRLRFEIAIPEELNNAPFPPMMLPTLVENAIKHGLEPNPAGGEIRITAVGQDGKLKVSVADTGMGFSDKPGSGMGLANIRERLQALYDGKAGLTIEPNSPEGTIATIEVPNQPNDAHKSPNRR
jgi:chemotaxis protein histidine kinase CheA